ncbi:MAG: hypothetical protein QG575_269 [Euryarchaeota archaeon]|nr:hypothetical protein [Euryarchaeota archaeon]
MKKAGFAIFILMLAGLASAAPMPQQMIVNNDSMQCARFLPGDECMDCTPPVGWEVLGPYSSCPEGYTLVTVNGNCKGFQREHCCTQKHSGASGDCRNMVKNNLTKQCAFVNNAIDYPLPAGWMKMPEDAILSSWVCPLDYAWMTLTATIPVVVAQYGPVNVVSAKNDDFKVNSGNYVSGWTWLKEPGQFASWTFYNLPTDRKLYIYLAPLVTRPSGNGGGSGYSTDVKITYESRTGSINATVSLKNTHPEFKMPADTMGWGYQTIGYLMIPADKIPLDGKITVALTKYPNAEHVAVNKECCCIEYV